MNTWRDAAPSGTGWQQEGPGEAQGRGAGGHGWLCPASAAPAMSTAPWGGGPTEHPLTAVRTDLIGVAGGDSDDTQATCVGLLVVDGGLSGAPGGRLGAREPGGHALSPAASSPSEWTAAVMIFLQVKERPAPGLLSVPEGPRSPSQDCGGGRGQGSVQHGHGPPATAYLFQPTAVMSPALKMAGNRRT